MKKLCILLAIMLAFGLVNNAFTQEVIVQGNSLREKMDWLAAFQQSDIEYVIEFNADETVGNLSFGGRITLRGVGANRTLSYSGNDTMLSVGSVVTLDNITLKGRNVTNVLRRTLVTVRGRLIMNNGAAIIDNTSLQDVNTRSGGGGVYVGPNGTLIMNNGTISGNKLGGQLLYGAGVYIEGTFIMNGGTISDNSLIIQYSSPNVGGVYVGERATFTMNGGTISNNSESGVFVEGSFFMNDGTISGHRSGGVYVAGKGTFTMSGGNISGNRGGGVRVTDTRGEQFSYGSPGVLTSPGMRFWAVGGGTFIMTGGTISGNTVGDYGGGVYVTRFGTFTKTGGTITGYTSDQNNGNRVTTGNYRGHAVYAGPSYSFKIKDGTAGPEDNLSYNGRTPNGVEITTGAWDN